MRPAGLIRQGRKVLVVDGFTSRTLSKEVMETFLLLTIAALILGGYLGLALFFLEAVR